MANGPFTSFGQTLLKPNPFGGTMKAKVLVPVDRNAALEAIRALDALGDALRAYEARWPKSLKRQVRDARRDLLDAVGIAAFTNGIDAPGIALD
jgi:hypothetical protein